MMITLNLIKKNILKWNYKKNKKIKSKYSIKVQLKKCVSPKKKMLALNYRVEDILIAEKFRWLKIYRETYFHWNEREENMPFLILHCRQRIYVIGKDFF